MAESRIQRVGTASIEATSITLPTHQLGDIILIFAFRDNSTTNPTLPTGFTNITNTLDGTTCSVTMGWKIAGSNAETSGTWTNATGLICHVYRGVDNVMPFGTLQSNAGTSTTVTYGSTQGVGKDRMNNQWFVAFAGNRSIDTTNMAGAPTGYSIRETLLGAVNDMVSFDTNGPVKAGAASNGVAVGGTGTGWITAQLPIYPAMQRFNNYQQVRVEDGMNLASDKVR